MKQWLNQFSASWRDKDFVCAVLGFLFAYAVIAALGLVLPAKIFVLILAAIAGWQLASWSWQLAPKLKEVLQRLKIFS
jgi:hypothetical protein